MVFTIVSYAGTSTIEAESIWDAAGIFAAEAAGFDCEEICWDPFSFTVDDVHFCAEIVHVSRVSRSGGKIKVSTDKETKLFDEYGRLDD